MQDRLHGQLEPASELARQWAPALLAVTLVGFFYLTVFPFDFTLHAGQRFDFHLYDPSDLVDWGMNVLLGLPVGFALAAWAVGRRWSWIRAALSAILVLLLCSAVVECLQLFLPGRISALADILANTTGGLVGCIVFLLLGRGLLAQATHAARILRRRVAGLWGAAVLVAVVGMVCAVPIYLLRWPRLAVWNAQFPLLVGNENNVGDEGFRQWTGTLHGLAIADRAATAEEVGRILADGNLPAVMGDAVVADYPLLGPGPYADRSHHLPPLAWAWQQPTIAQGAPARFDYRHFLSTTDSAAGMINPIVARDGFSICFTAASDDPEQSGPARLVTCSHNIFACNFMLAQVGHDLLIRLRTRCNGPEGDCPQWVVANLFRDPDPHRLLVTYDGEILRVYQDTPQRHWRVRTPTEYVLMRKFLAREQLTMPITGAGNLLYVGLFYMVGLLPIAGILGIFLARAIFPPPTAVRPRPIGQRLLVPAIGLLFATTAVYVTLDRMGIRAIGWTEFPLAGVILAIETALFGHWWARGPARPRFEASMARVTYAGYAS